MSLEEVCEMETVRKTYQEQLRPTPTQERALERVLWRCCTFYNTALAQRILLCKQRGVTVGRYQQEAELTTLRADMPEYAALHSHILQDVLARLDKTYQAFFCRVASGKWQVASSRASLGSRARTATTRVPTRSRATVLAWRTAVSS